MVGTILGNRYELLEKIGEGGMAVVYKAKCHLLNRFVAIKILKNEFNKDEDFVAKFKREASASAGLSQNNIVNIFDVGSEGDINYIVMEYINGKTLKDIIRENVRLSYSNSIDIAIQIAHALNCAHQNNIIHRDIKPQNILVTQDGVVKVTDFGIAKASNSITLTNDSKIIGSAHYFSPEQAKGNLVDCRTDIYALGIVLYEMVTGAVPYDAESPVSVAIMHIQQQVIAPKILVSDIFDSLNDLILKAIEKDPSNRYQNAIEILNDLVKIKNDPNYVVVQNKNESDYTRVMDPVRVIEPKMSSGSEPEDQNKKDLSTVKKTIIIVLVLLFVAIIGWGVGIWAAKNNSNPSTTASPTIGKDVTIPIIVGLSRADAEKSIRALGLEFTEVGSVPSDQPKGVVTDSVPAQGTKVVGKSEVRVTTSSGAKQITVPDVKIFQVSNAEDIIKNEKLVVGNKTYEYSDTVPKDSVIAQNPNPADNVEVGSKVDLTVSNGPSEKKSLVPDLTGKTLAQAKTLLENVGLKVGTPTAVASSDESQYGIIWLQIPIKGSNVVQGTAVDISYYSYKVPNFVLNFHTVGQAKTEALRLGLNLKFVDDNKVTVEPGNLDIVANQDLAVNSPSGILKGATITLTINKAD